MNEHVSMFQILYGKYIRLALGDPQIARLVDLVFENDEALQRLGIGSCLVPVRLVWYPVLDGMLRRIHQRMAQSHLAVSDWPKSFVRSKG